MHTDEYATLALREKTYWWHIGRLRIIEAYIVSFCDVRQRQQMKILNVGSGTGGTVSLLRRYGLVENVEVSDEAIAIMKLQGIENIIKTDNNNKLPFRAKTYDMVAAFDILEHIDMHKAALQEWSRILKDDGVLIITVPAYQWLWSHHDVALGHERRYTKRTLKTVAQSAGLQVHTISYAFAFSFPLVAGFRILDKYFGKREKTSYVGVPGWVNRLLTHMLYAEARLHKKYRLPFGSSVVAVLKKN